MTLGMSSLRRTRPAVECVGSLFHWLACRALIGIRIGEHRIPPYIIFALRVDAVDGSAVAGGRSTAERGYHHKPK